MPKPRRLSGPEVVEILKQFGFIVFSQRGSHVKMARDVDGGTQTLTISNHKELKTGTVVGMFRQASQFISPDELRKHFYSE